MLRTTLLLTAGLLTPALIATGCGGGSDGASDQRVREVGGAFTRTTGVKLRADDRDGTPRLVAADDEVRSRFGAFAIVFPRSDAARTGALIEGSGGTVSREFGPDVVVTGRPDDQRSLRLDQAMRAALDARGLPVAERACGTVGITAARGRSGTCWLGGERLTVVDAARTLTTPELRVRLLGADVTTTLIPRYPDTPPPRAPAGRWAVVRYVMTNRSLEPISTRGVSVVVRGEEYSEQIYDAGARIDQSDDEPLQPGTSRTLTTAVPIPTRAAKALLSEGQLRISRVTVLGRLDLEEGVSRRVRLAGAPRLGPV